MMPHIAFALLLGAVLIAVPILDQATEDHATGQDEIVAADETRGANLHAVTLFPDSRGHYLATVQVNGRSVSMLADTGASAVVLTEHDARRAGFNPGVLDYSVPVSTANGTAHVAAVTIERMEVEGIVLRGVDAFVAAPEALEHSLLGMSFIGRLTRFSMEDGRLLLVQ